MKRASYILTGYQASKQASDVMDWFVWIHCKVEAGTKKKFEA